MTGNYHSKPGHVPLVFALLFASYLFIMLSPSLADEDQKTVSTSPSGEKGTNPSDTSEPASKTIFSVLGEVVNPGVFKIEKDQQLNVIEAIATAGGYTEKANQIDVAVKRMVKGKWVVLHVNAKAMAINPDIVPLEILPGDIIYIRESQF